VNEECVLILNSHAGVAAITVNGNASTTIGAAGSLRIYTNGDLSIGGSGITNSAGQASKFSVFSTSTSGSQNISLVGTAQLIGSVYAPTAAVSITGGGASGGFYGAVVARTVTMTGNSNFHYDEALAFGGAENPVRVGQWRELRTTAERAGYSTDLAF
jgi:hypothetical protein